MQNQIWDRRLSRFVTEKVYGNLGVKLLYGNPIGFQITHHFLSKPWVSKILGKIQSAPKSKSRIPEFIQNYEIPMEDYEGTDFPSFNDFFIRKFKPGIRNFTQNPSELAAPAEGRYLAFEKLGDQFEFNIKDVNYNLSTFLAGSKHRDNFVQGPMMIARLCPVDYHRFHFPDDGKIIEYTTAGGILHSVNPLAVKRYPEVFNTNERQISILETKSFGLLAYVEVGALFVGKIVQSYGGKSEFKRGDEKGYFLFGASTVVIIGEKGKWSPDEDLLRHTLEGVESLVRLGECVGRKK